MGRVPMNPYPRPLHRTVTVCLARAPALGRGFQERLGEQERPHELEFCKAVYVGVRGTLEPDVTQLLLYKGYFHG